MLSAIRRLRTGLLLGIFACAALLPPAWAQPATPFPEFQTIDLGPAFRGANPRVLGMDGAFSVPVDKGRSLWIFGDTLLGGWRPNGDRHLEGMPPNTAVLVDDKDWVTGFSRAQFIGRPDPIALMRPSKSSYRIWPLDVVRTGKRFHPYYVEIEPFGKGPLDFRVVGTGVFTGEGLPSGPLKTRVPLWKGDEPSFGASVLEWQDAWYLYAGGAQTHLARATGPLDRPGSYRYWAGDDRWVTDPKQAAPMPGSGPEVSVRYNAYLKSFVMVYVPPFGNKVEARFAPKPWGPWSEPLTLAACQPAGETSAMFYGAKQHAELDVDGGRQIVLSYNTNVPEALLEQRPDLYWPRLLRVTFR